MNPPPPDLPVDFADTSAAIEVLTSEVVDEFFGQLALDETSRDHFTETLLALGTTIEGMALAKASYRVGTWPGVLITGILPARDFGLWLSTKARRSMAAAKDLNERAQVSRATLALKLAADLQARRAR